MTVILITTNTIIIIFIESLKKNPATLLCLQHLQVLYCRTFSLQTEYTTLYSIPECDI